MSNYSEAVLADSPSVYYRLDDTSTTMADSSGNGKNGTLSGGHTREATGLAESFLAGSKCVDFGGSSGKGVATIGTFLTSATVLTVEFWFNADATTGDKYLLNVYDATYVNGIRFYFQGTTLRMMATTGGSETFNNFLDTTISTGTRYHVVGIMDIANDTMSLYINGSVVHNAVSKSFEYSSLTHGSSAAVTLASTGSSLYFDGKLDEVAVYTTALSSTRISAHYTAANTYGVNPPKGSVSLAVLSPVFSPYQIGVPTGSLAVQGKTPLKSGKVAWPPAASLSLADFDPTMAAKISIGQKGSLSLADFDPPRYTWSVPPQVSYVMVYRLTLTGTPDGKPDVELPMSSFQARARDAAQTYISAVVPYTTDNATSIADRPNGELVIKSGPHFPDGSETLTEILRVTLDSVATDRGAVNGSITLSGYANAVTRTAISRTMAGVSYTRSSNTDNQIRCQPDLWLQPGDTASDPNTGLSFTVGSIAYVISPTRQEMTVND